MIVNNGRIYISGCGRNPRLDKQVDKYRDRQVTRWIGNGQQVGTWIGSQIRSLANILSMYDRLLPYMTSYTAVYMAYTIRIRLPYFTVFRRIRLRPYTIVIRSHVIRQNTVVYGRISPYTVVYNGVYDRIRRRIRQ